MKISGYIKLSEDELEDFENEEDEYEDDEEMQIPNYCKRCNHNTDWPDCVIECRKWRAEL